MCCSPLSAKYNTQPIMLLEINLEAPLVYQANGTSSHRKLTRAHTNTGAAWDPLGVRPQSDPQIIQQN